MRHRKTWCSFHFYNGAINSFYSKKSAAPGICKYIFLLQKERTPDRGTEGGFDSCEQNKMQNINNNLYGES